MLRLPEVTKEESFDVDRARELWEQVKSVLEPVVNHKTPEQTLGQTMSAVLSWMATEFPLQAESIGFMVGLAVGQGAIVIDGFTFPDFTKEG